MSNTLREVNKILPRKLSAYDAANLLKITEQEYKDLSENIRKAQRKILNTYEDEVINLAQGKSNVSINQLVTDIIETENDLDAGTQTIKALVSYEPKSAEDIIEEFKIDTSKWKLSNYWNKQQSNGKYLVSALITKLKDNDINLEETLKNINIPTIPIVKASELNIAMEKVCGVLSLQDLHFGKTGNENIEEILMDCVEYLMIKSYDNYYMERIIIVAGGDLLNMDTFSGTTTNGTPVDNSLTAMQAFDQAYDAMAKVIGVVKQFCKYLTIVYIPGNHDRLSSYHLISALSKGFKNQKDLVFDLEHKERKACLYGKNMFGFAHGDVVKITTPLIYATEYPEFWGNAINRVLYTGHTHGKKNKEFITENEVCGFVTKIIPALTNTDYWHNHNEFVGNKRASLIDIYDDGGQVGQFTYNAKFK